MFLVADASQREELAKQFLTRLPLTEDHAEWRVVLNAIELLIQQGNQEVRDRKKIEISDNFRSQDHSSESQESNDKNVFLKIGSFYH